MARARSHANNFGFLRLFFAGLVVVSHSFELIDGNRSREPLTAIFGTHTLAELGVDGFFIVSGYLIAQSFDTSSSIVNFMWKRVLRIYPAFLVAFALCLVVVGPLAGAHITAANTLPQIGKALLLKIPSLQGAFPSLHYPSLNGSTWTIKIEFRCYLLVAVLGALALKRKSGLLIFGLASLLAGCALLVVGRLPEGARLTVIFVFGVMFYAFRDSIRYKPALAVAASVVLSFSLLSPVASYLAIPTCGAYLVFWFAFLPDFKLLNGVGGTRDISYGVYLYAFPLQNLAIMHIPTITPGTLMLLAGTGAALLGWISWTVIEKPCLALKRRREFSRPVIAPNDLYSANPKGGAI